MITRYYVALYRLFFAVLVIVAIVAQFIHGMQNSATFSVSNFFSFFTIQSNILAAIIFLIAGIAGLLGKQGSQLAWIRGAATFYMTTTGIIYVLLLSGLEASLQTPIPWINTVLHYIMPVAVLADWLIHRPKREITPKMALPWLIFPLAYVPFTLIRGQITGWYPYPFLNPEKQGYAQLIITCVIIGVALIILAYLLALSTRHQPVAKAHVKATTRTKKH